jgi:hypothetical protein
VRFGGRQPGRLLPALARLGTAREETAVRDEIQRLSLDNRHYGYRRITVLLKRTGWVVNHKRVQRLRAEDNLLCVPKTAFRPATTDSRHRFTVYPNLARKLVPTAVNQLWIADITYVRLAEEFVYLAVVLDAFSRRVIGWCLAGSSAGEPGAGCAGDGAARPRCGARGSAAPFRPRGAICVRRLYRASAAGRHPAEHEPSGLPLGQRDGGELHADIET